MPVSPLVQAVASNALSAAFGDPRFEPVEEAEFADLCIEISLLSVPAELAFSSLADLQSKLAATHPGVILRRGAYQATFLPQVWEQLPDVHGFLEALCHKAGLRPESLSQPGLSVFTYTVEAFCRGLRVVWPPTHEFPVLPSPLQREQGGVSRRMVQVAQSLSRRQGGTLSPARSTPVQPASDAPVLRRPSSPRNAARVEPATSRWLHASRHSCFAGSAICCSFSSQ